MKFPKRSIFYIPGLLSLTLLFIMCYLYLSSKDALEKQVMIEVSWWNPKSSLFFNRDPYNPQPRRDYITYNLTGDEKNDKQSLSLAQKEIRKQKSQNDTIKGVHFHFKEKAKYWTLVKAFDICLEENVESYLPFKSDIYIFNFPKQKEEVTFICGTSDFPIEHYKTIEEIEEDKRKELAFVINSLQQFWPSIILFLLLIIFTIKQKGRNTATRTTYTQVKFKTF